MPRMDQSHSSAVLAVLLGMAVKVHHHWLPINLHPQSKHNEHFTPAAHVKPKLQKQQKESKTFSFNAIKSSGMGRFGQALGYFADNVL